MGNQLAVQEVISGHGIPILLDDLLRTQTVVVILEVQSGILCAHVLQATANLPLVRPDTVTGGITNGIVGEAAFVISCQLIRISLQLSVDSLTAIVV